MDAQPGDFGSEMFGPIPSAVCAMALILLGSLAACNHKSGPGTPANDPTNPPAGAGGAGGAYDAEAEVTPASHDVVVPPAP